MKYLSIFPCTAALFALSASFTVHAAPASIDTPACSASAARADYLGSYKLADGGELKVVERQQRYFASIDGQRSFELIETKPGQLVGKGKRIAVSFCAPARDNATDVVVEQNFDKVPSLAMR
jgi:hypothetical protein